MGQEEEQARRFEAFRGYTIDAALLAHNAYEDRELHAILPKIDAWGEIRDALVDERHTAEHDAIGVGIRAAASHFSAGEIADRTEEVIAQLLGHMDREEREFLHAEVLRDDIVTSGVGG